MPVCKYLMAGLHVMSGSGVLATELHGSLNTWTTTTQRWINAGPASPILAQHYAKVGHIAA